MKATVRKITADGGQVKWGLFLDVPGLTRPADDHGPGRRVFGQQPVADRTP